MTWSRTARTAWPRRWSAECFKPCRPPPKEAAIPRDRARALVAQLTLDEKISLVHGTGFITGNGYTGFTPAIERLGIPAFYLADGPTAWATAPAA
jgi:beta-glucosidase